MLQDRYGNTTDRDRFLRSLPDGWRLEDREEDFGLLRGLKWTLAGAAFWLLLWWVLG